jgi:all-trans-retinol 13,14-reductase
MPRWDAADEEAAPPGAPTVVPRIRARAILEREWDAIVVGSGIGGLVTAALLAKKGALRVLVLERHYEPGGLTQTFKRRRHIFDVGVHYVGDMGSPRSPTRRLFDVVSEGRIAWSPLPPIHDRFRIDGAEVGVGRGIERTRAAFVDFAPREEAAIDRYLDEVQTCARQAPAFLLDRTRGRVDARTDRAPFYRWADATTAEVLAGLGASPRLSALLTAHFGNYGERPSTSSFAAHALATAHYFGGAHYPVGGGGRLAKEIAATIATNGGAVVVRAEVDEILLEGDTAVGARLGDGREVRAPIVVSDVGAALTFGRLLPEGAPHVGELRERVGRIGASGAHTALYVGLDRSPRELGLDGANLWLSSLDADGDHGRLFEWIDGARDAPPGLFVSFTCANDPSAEARMPGRASLVASVIIPYAPFDRWSDTARARRGPEYDALKARLTRQTLALLCRAVPQIADHVEHAEMSTPLTTKHFAAHLSGETCGLAHTPARFRLGPSAGTPIKGLYLTGQDAWLCGVAGAGFGALASASVILGRDLLRELVFGVSG